MINAHIFLWELVEIFRSTHDTKMIDKAFLT